MKKIMLVDDDATMKTLLRTLLEMEGYQVFLWEIGTDVVAEMRREKPDVMVLDVNLNNLSGFDVLQRVRDDEILKGTQVIMSSGMDYSEKCKREGVEAFLLKPYMPDDLMAIIRKYMK